MTENEIQEALKDIEIVHKAAELLNCSVLELPRYCKKLYNDVEKLKTEIADLNDALKAQNVSQ